MTHEIRKASLGLTNARKHDVWLPEFDKLLETPDGCLTLLNEVIKAGWEGRIAARTMGGINNAVRMKLDYWASAKRIKELEDQVAQIVQLLPPEIKLKVEADMKNET
jgi:hypothetical protein